MFRIQGVCSILCPSWVMSATRWRRPPPSSLKTGKRNAAKDRRQRPRAAIMLSPCASLLGLLLYFHIRPCLGSFCGAKNDVSHLAGGLSFFLRLSFCGAVLKMLRANFKYQAGLLRTRDSEMQMVNKSEWACRLSPPCTDVFDVESTLLKRNAELQHIAVLLLVRRWASPAIISSHACLSLVLAWARLESALKLHSVRSQAPLSCERPRWGRLVASCCLTEKREAKAHGISGASQHSTCWQQRT